MFKNVWDPERIYVVAAGSSFLCSRIIFKYSNHANYWNYFKGKHWVFKVGFIMLDIQYIYTIQLQSTNTCD